MAVKASYRYRVHGMAEEALDVVYELMKDKEITPRVRLAAAQDILDRADANYNEYEHENLMERTDRLFDPKYAERKRAEAVTRLDELRSRYRAAGSTRTVQ